MDYSVKKEYIMQAKHFFEPFVGDNYSEGIYGKRVLVLGASFYCNQDGVSVDKETGEVKEKCPFYDDCAINQNTEKYDGKCPYNHNSPLRKLPQTELDENGAESYKRFWLLLYHYFQQPELSFDDIWGKMAFTNYVQHEIGGRWNTLASDCRAEYLEMFEDTLLTMKEQPDVVIVWGCIVDKPLKAKTLHSPTKITIGSSGRILTEKTSSSCASSILVLQIFILIKNGTLCWIDWKMFFAFKKVSDILFCHL